MSKRVLILTQPRDLHAYAVARALELKGHTAILWHTSDFPSLATETVGFDHGQRSIRSRGLSFTLSEDGFDTVWNRRPNYVIPEKLLHPADVEFAELGCRLFRKSLFDLLCPQAFWVNPHEAMRRLTKLLQHNAAVEVGLDTPATLFTNDPLEIRKFLRAQGGEIVFKPISTLPWKTTDTFYMTFTSLLTEDSLVDDEILQAAPAIYQERVEKSHELRVTVMGHETFTARILSQETNLGKLDWRKAYDELRMERDDIPPELKERCIELLRRLGFVFGCFDFVVTPDGRYVFLEVNQMGQFLFLERYCGLPLLDAFSDFLAEGSASFQWRAPGRTLYLEMAEEIQRAARDAEAEHRPLPPQFWLEE